MSPKVQFVICTLLAVVVIQTCVRIERLNALNDYYLPRETTGKWRVAAQRSTRMAAERTVLSKRMNDFAASNPGVPLPSDNEIMSQPLTKTETSYVEAELFRSRLWDRFYDVVASWGLLQYIIAPVLLVWSFCLVRTKISMPFKITSAIYGAISIVCMGFMFYRGYFTSVGWLD